MKKPTISTLDAILPQTQCGLCSYGACLPYAKALAEEDAPINLCPPGGTETLKKLAELLHKDPTPFMKEMQQNTKAPTRAVIREDECIGCTKCIQVCPVDAIIGASKQMHTVLSDECTGCDLCLEPCPMDCIDMVPIVISEPATIKLQANRARQRYHFRQARLDSSNGSKSRIPPFAEESMIQENNPLGLDTSTRKNAIQEAVARAAAKRHQQKSD